MQNPNEKTNAKTKEKIIVQTSHLGYGKLQMAFCRGIAEQVDKAICDEAEQIIKKKRKKRKKEFPNGTLKCSTPED